MGRWIKHIVTGEEFVDSETTDDLDRFISAMTEEGFYSMKPGCDANPEINPDDPRCLKGSPFVEKRALDILVGDLQCAKARLVDNDNFHPASEVVHIHHPDTNSTCSAGCSEACVVEHISITENVYDNLKEGKVERTPVAATHMTVKMKSIQSIRQAAGELDANFTKLDMNNEECQNILKASISYAEDLAGLEAYSAYQEVGQTMMTDEDIPMTNGGLWEYEGLATTEDSEKTFIMFQSKSLPLDHNQLVPMFKDMHYCKLLSPFRALEWIYVDSQYARGGYVPPEESKIPLVFLE